MRHKDHAAEPLANQLARFLLVFQFLAIRIRVYRMATLSLIAVPNLIGPKQTPQVTQ
jgi:hypothetical protein